MLLFSTTYYSFDAVLLHLLCPLWSGNLWMLSHFILKEHCGVGNILYNLRNGGSEILHNLLWLHS